MDKQTERQQTQQRRKETSKQRDNTRGLRRYLKERGIPPDVPPTQDE